MLSPALAALAAYTQFILYKAVPSPRPGKTDKIPCSPAGGISSIQSKVNWMDHDTAEGLAAMYGPEYGVGFVLTMEDPFFCLDIDNAVENHQWKPIVAELTSALDIAFEVSRSGTGCHLWGMGTMPPHGCRNATLGLELYHANRFIALGTTGAHGSIRDCSAQLPAVVERYFPPSGAGETPVEWTTAPVPEWRGPADDEELIRRMLRSKPSPSAMLAGKPSLAQLWDADQAALTRGYPSGDTRPYNASSADAALAVHLLWWTGRDCERSLRLMRKSALTRDKYERRDYLQRTILAGMVIGDGGVYIERDPDMPPVSPVPKVPAKHEARERNGHVITTPEQQLDMWKGFVYVAERDGILTDKGDWWSTTVFGKMFGGRIYTYTQDGKTTPEADRAFIDTQVLESPRADRAAFRPDLPVDQMWHSNGRTYVNEYRHPIITRSPGDVSPFLNHLTKLLPVARDREIIVAYIAALVQYQGVKFQWAPVIQGTEGNGKSLISKCVEYAIGTEYTHFAKADQLIEKFNDWMLRKIVICVEDIYVPDSRAEIIEILKPMITSSRLPIRAMRTTERTMDVCANFIINSNHKDAIRKTRNDRRWCVMYCSQQSSDDLIRDGMTGGYFTRLYHWLNNGGYAHVADYLYNYSIPDELGMHCLLSRAPDTSSTEEAIIVGLGRIEQEVQEAIDSGTRGFSGGFVNSLELDKLLTERKMAGAMPRARRRAMLQAMGYDWHPALRNGRLTCNIPGTLDKPVMYIKNGHAAMLHDTSHDIVQAYVRAQSGGAAGLTGVFSKQS